jgi:hypothetical protein
MLLNTVGQRVSNQDWICFGCYTCSRTRYILNTSSYFSSEDKSFHKWEAFCRSYPIYKRLPSVPLRSLCTQYVFGSAAVLERLTFFLLEDMSVKKGGSWNTPLLGAHFDQKLHMFSTRTVGARCVLPIDSLPLMSFLSKVGREESDLSFKLSSRPSKETCSNASGELHLRSFFLYGSTSKTFLVLDVGG